MSALVCWCDRASGVPSPLFGETGDGTAVVPRIPGSPLGRGRADEVAAVTPPTALRAVPPPRSGEGWSKGRRLGPDRVRPPVLPSPLPSFRRKPESICDRLVSFVRGTGLGPRSGRGRAFCRGDKSGGPAPIAQPTPMPPHPARLGSRRSPRRTALSHKGRGNRGGMVPRMTASMPGTRPGMTDNGIAVPQTPGSPRARGRADEVAAVTPPTALRAVPSPIGSGTGSPWTGEGWR